MINYLGVMLRQKYVPFLNFDIIIADGLKSVLGFHLTFLNRLVEEP